MSIQTVILSSKVWFGLETIFIFQEHNIHLKLVIWAVMYLKQVWSGGIWAHLRVLYTEYSVPATEGSLDCQQNKCAVYTQISMCQPVSSNFQSGFRNAWHFSCSFHCSGEIFTTSFTNILHDYRYQLRTLNEFVTVKSVLGNHLWQKSRWHSKIAC